GKIELKPGSRIQVKGLTKSTELNGLDGSLLQFDAAKCRWGVELDNGKKVMLKMGNLVPLNAEVAPIGPGDPGHEPQACPGPPPASLAPPAGAPSLPPPEPPVEPPAEPEAEKPPAAEAPAGPAAEASEAAVAPALSEDDWPVLPTKPEVAAQMKSGCWFDGGSAAKRFIQQLRANDPSLVSVCLVPPKRFDDEDAREICDALNGNTCCREFVASGHSLSEETCQRLAGMLRATGAIQTFSVGDSSLGDRARCLFEALAENSSVTSLDLEHKGLVGDSLESLAAALAARAGRGAPPLAALRLSQNPGLSVAGLQRLAACPAPRALQLCECRLGPDLGEVLGRLVAAGVEDLDLRDNPALGGAVEEMLSALMPAERGRAAAPLRRLRLDGCAVGDDGLEAVACALERGLGLEELFVERCELTLEGCSRLAESLRGRRLHALSVRANVIGDEGCELLSRCAARLDLSSTGLGGLVLPALGEQPLVALELFSNPTLGPSVASWSATLEEAQWQRLEHLDLGGCALRDEGCVHLCNTLLDRPSLMPSLAFLCLGANDIEKEEDMFDLVDRLAEARGGRLSVLWQNK
ncbi:unnamed protein product, partial [Prorocentrum cordatum]